MGWRLWDQDTDTFEFNSSQLLFIRDWQSKTVICLTSSGRSQWRNTCMIHSTGAFRTAMEVITHTERWSYGSPFRLAWAMTSAAPLLMTFVIYKGQLACLAIVMARYTASVSTLGDKNTVRACLRSVPFRYKWHAKKHISLTGWWWFSDDGVNPFQLLRLAFANCTHCKTAVTGRYKEAGITLLLWLIFTAINNSVTPQQFHTAAQLSFYRFKLPSKAIKMADTIGK